MTQEEKKILFKDLCARLAYGVKVKVERTTANGEKIEDEGVLNSIFINEFGTIYVCVDEKEYELEDIKPYLRPMSSMTEEEKREIYDWLVENDVDWFDFSKLRLDEILISFDSSWLLINWLNAHHFDYRGLIGKGLAIEVTEDNNPYKN